MAPKKKARGSASQAVSTPTTTKSDDAMDVDTPRSASPSKPSESKTPTIDIHNDMWTDDQLSSLFKGVIRWKPAGMHKHFRMIAISEHLRNHGFDPDVLTHTRIPAIWDRLRAYYNLDVIDDRENFDDDGERYLEFGLGRQFHDLIEERVRASSAEESSESEDEETEERDEDREGKAEEKEDEEEEEKPEATPEPKPKPARRKGKRGSERLKDRSSTVEDSDDATEAESPAPKAPRTTARGRGRGRGRGGRGGRAVASKQASEEAEESSDSEEEESGSDEESAEERPAKPTRGGRGGRGRGGRSRGRGRGRGR